MGYKRGSVSVKIQVSARTQINVGQSLNAKQKTISTNGWTGTVTRTTELLKKRKHMKTAEGSCTQICFANFYNFSFHTKD